MSELTERVARAIQNGPPDDPQACAEAAIREVLAAFREWPGDRPDARSAILDEAFRAWLEAFARHHGLEP